MTEPGRPHIELGPGQLWWGPAGAPPPRPRRLCHVCLAPADGLLAYRDELRNYYCGREHFEQGRPAPVVVARDGTQDAVLLGGPSAGQRVVIPSHLNEIVIAVNAPLPYDRDEIHPTTAATFAQVAYHRAWPPQHVDGHVVFTTTGQPHPDHLERVYRGARAHAPQSAATYSDVLGAIERAFGSDSWERGPDAATWRADDTDPEPYPDRPTFSLDMIADASAAVAAFERAYVASWFASLVNFMPTPVAPYRDGHRAHAVSVAALGRLFDVPRWVLDGTGPSPARRRAVRTAYRHRQLARRRRR